MPSRCAVNLWTVGCADPCLTARARSATAHKLHSTQQQHRMNLISGNDQTSSRLPVFSLSLPGTCPNNRDRRILAEMERVVPWPALCGLIEPFYPKAGNGRPPVGVERMLRIYFVQQWFNLSDPAVEEALYDSLAMRDFVGIDLGREPVPDETTVCRFRHLLETHDLGRQLFDEVQRHLAAKGLKVATGTIVDATIINAPSSTKNADKARDPEMHQTKKGNQWYFGMKAHFGVDSRSKLIHAAVVTPANVADSKVLPDLLHGNETRVWGDQAYRGQRAVIQHAPRAQDFVNRRYRH